MVKMDNATIPAVTPVWLIMALQSRRSIAGSGEQQQPAPFAPFRSGASPAWSGKPDQRD